MNPVVDAFAEGIRKSGIELSRICVASDIPFEPETTKSLGIDFFHTPRGRSIAFGIGLWLSNPRLKVVPFVGDLITLGGNHFIHAGRRNMEFLVICINNFMYKKIGGQAAPVHSTEFSAYSTFEEPFNIPHLANSCGAVYTARWTALHKDEIADSVAEALNKRGFCVIEILSPGPNFYKSIKEVQDELLKFYYANSVIRNGEDPRNVAINSDKKIIVGKFTDKEKPTFIDLYNTQLSNTLGDKFKPYGISNKHE